MPELPFLSARLPSIDAEKTDEETGHQDDEHGDQQHQRGSHAWGVVRQNAHLVAANLDISMNVYGKWCRRT